MLSERNFLYNLCQIRRFNFLQEKIPNTTKESNSWSTAKTKREKKIDNFVCNKAVDLHTYKHHLPIMSIIYESLLFHCKNWKRLKNKSTHKSSKSVKQLAIIVTAKEITQLLNQHHVFPSHLFSPGRELHFFSIKLNSFIHAMRPTST